MPMTLSPQRTDEPRDVIDVAPDAPRVAPDAPQVAPDTPKVESEEDELSSLLRQAARRSTKPPGQAASDSPVADPPETSIDTTTFRPVFVPEVVAPEPPRPAGNRAMRFVLVLLLAAGIGGTAVAWQSSGELAARLRAHWASISGASSPRMSEPQATAAPSVPPAVEQAATEPAPLQQPLTQTPSDGVAPNAIALSSADSERLQSMARDLEAAGQEIVQLKASIEQLKAAHDQLARDVARTPARTPTQTPQVQSPRPRAATAPPPAPRPAAAAPVRRLPPQFQPQAAAAPMMPPQAAPSYMPPPPEPSPPAVDMQGEPVVRPPMPLR